MKPCTRSRFVTIEPEVARARLRALVVVARDRSARDHAPERAEREQGRLELRPADVVEVDVDPVGERILRGGHVVVVRLDPERLQPRHLLGRPDAADHAQPLEPRDLRRDRADRPGGAGDPDRLALLDAADVDEADPGGQPGHPEHAERGRRRRELRDRACAGGRPPATPCSRQPSLDSTQSPSAKPACREATTRPTAAPSTTSPTSNPTDVRAHAGHAAAHVRVDRDEDVADERPRRRPARASGASRSSKSVSRGSPAGRAARTTSLLTPPAPADRG